MQHPSPLTNAICLYCGYDMAGIAPNSQGLIKCPECGRDQRAMRHEEPLTAKEMHRRFAKGLLLPTVGVQLFALSLACVPVLNILLGFAALASLFFLSIGVWGLQVPDTLWDARIHPRQVPRWKIILWSILYLLPQLGFAYLYYTIVTSIPIQV